MPFTIQELEELRRADEEIDRAFSLTTDEVRASRALDAAARRKAEPEATGEALSYYERNREKILARRRAHYAAHREEILARRRAWRARNKEKIRAYNRHYYAEHRADIIAYNSAKRSEQRLARREEKARKGGERK